MADGSKNARDPAVAHQPSKAELEEDVRVTTTPEALAWAVTRGGADRKESAESPSE